MPLPSDYTSMEYPRDNILDMEKMRNVLQAIQFDTYPNKPQAQQAKAENLEEYTALVIPGVGGSIEVRLNRCGGMVEVSVGSVKLSVKRAILQQLVTKLHEEFQMEKLGK
jgi:hypothetical protein